MRRAAWVLSSLLLCSAPALAQFAGDYRWQPRAAAIGDAGTRARVQGERRIVWVLSESAAREEQTTETIRSDCKWAFTREIQSVRRGKVTKERYEIERFECIDDGGFPDDALQGKQITVTISKGRRRAKIAGVRISKLSGVVRRWMDDVVLRDLDPLLDVIYPKGEVGSGDTWAVDPIDVAILWGLHEMSSVDPEQSSAKAKLSNVRLDPDVHVGDVDVDIKLRLGSFPKYRLRWRDGGALAAKIHLEGPLEASVSKPRKLTVDGRLTGSAVGTLPSGERVTRTVELRVERREVVTPLPKEAK